MKENQEETDKDLILEDADEACNKIEIDVKKEIVKVTDGSSIT